MIRSLYSHECDSPGCTAEGAPYGGTSSMSDATTDAQALGWTVSASHCRAFCPQHAEQLADDTLDLSGDIEGTATRSAEVQSVSKWGGVSYRLTYAWGERVPLEVVERSGRLEIRTHQADGGRPALGKATRKALRDHARSLLSRL